MPQIDDEIDENVTTNEESFLFKLDTINSDKRKFIIFDWI